jgi:hypothetical protein
MPSAKLQFMGSLTQTDPHVHPVLIIGQVKNLAKIKFSDIKVKLEPRVTEEVCTHCILINKWKVTYIFRIFILTVFIL